LEYIFGFSHKIQIEVINYKFNYQLIFFFILKIEEMDNGRINKELKELQDGVKNVS